MNFNREMSICRGCLAADRKMASATLYEAEFKDLTGITISPSDRLPQWLCYECVALLQKCVKFGNKVMRSHYTLCKYVLESVPFTCNKEDNLYLSRSTILHYDILGTRTEQQEDPFDNSAVSGINLPVIAKKESVDVKDEIEPGISNDKITAEECRERIYHNNTDVARKSSACYLPQLETSNICFVTLNHEERTEQREVEELSPGVADAELETVVVKYESSCSDDDDITIEEWCMDQPNELKSKTSIRIQDREEGAEQEQTAPELVGARTCAARHSVRAREHLHEHTNIALSQRQKINGEEVKSNVNNDDSVNDNSCNTVKFMCNECKKCFSNKRSLITHSRVHSKQKVDQNPYLCNVCKICFTRKSSYNAHMRIHIEDNPYKCKVCMKCFSNISNYTKHMRIHNAEKPYKCDVCMKCFSDKSQYRGHMRIHNGEKPYKCDVCMKCFRFNGDCKTHMRIHTGEKPYKCDVCMKCFSDGSSYKRHIRIHNSEKPYKCDVCMKSFKVKSYYSSHMRTHNGKKPYKCDVCMKCFNFNGDYKAHMRIHTGEKPYKCDVCMKCFTHGSAYRKHIRNHTGS